MEKRISALFEKTNYTLTNEDQNDILEVITKLDSGALRIAEKNADKWLVNEWLKKAILLYFRMQKIFEIKSEDLSFYDKIPVKKWSAEMGVRCVPPAIARFGCYIEKGVILMPSFVNIGAYVGAGTMVDTWATVGSCAQVGKNVHLSGGVGLGGVLEPLQAQPVIVEDNCFLGSRAVVVEGVHLEEGVVLGAGVVLTGSTNILDVSGSETQQMKGRVPKNSVVIPGTQNKKFPAGEFQVHCALIIGKRKESTDLKTSLNNALRDFQVSV